MEKTEAEARRLMPLPEAQYRVGGIGKSKLYMLVEEGDLVKVNVGTRAFITSDSVDAYIERLAAAAAAETA